MKINSMFKIKDEVAISFDMIGYNYIAIIKPIWYTTCKDEKFAAEFIGRIELIQKYSDNESISNENLEKRLNTEFLKSKIQALYL